uniref:Uncharacterized protein n=1 Tax=Alexandrium monilatum TaxID=311494 RepID=A0A7S4V3I6_9DINO|mmetsp:Transcript_10505/g.33260  ORF Transcript_10505/g.33260 Transcript_10505/m.33260 type:complete len:192 (-) Transcript_10505:147-722(-)
MSLLLPGLSQAGTAPGQMMEEGGRMQNEIPEDVEEVRLEDLQSPMARYFDPSPSSVAVLSFDMLEAPWEGLPGSGYEGRRGSHGAAQLSQLPAARPATLQSPGPASAPPLPPTVLAPQSPSAESSSSSAGRAKASASPGSAPTVPRPQERSASAAPPMDGPTAVFVDLACLRRKCVQPGSTAQPGTTPSAS